MLKLEVGKKYRSRKGDVWECTGLHHDSAYTHECETAGRATCFLKNGNYWSVVDKPSEDDLIEEVVDEDEIPPGSLVPPEKLELAREMCRNGEPFFVTAKRNGPDSGYLPASAERTREWDSDWFYFKRGPLTSEPDDPQGDVELRDDDVITEAEPQGIKLEVGKRYRSRQGDVWDCVEHHALSTLPFRCKSGERDTWFAANGGYSSRNDWINDDDLIEEVVDEAATIEPGDEFSLENPPKLRRVHISHGCEFTNNDVETCRLAAQMQSDGVAFEFWSPFRNDWSDNAGDPIDFRLPGWFRRRPEPQDDGPGFDGWEERYGEQSTLPDSGDRTNFSTGAVRDAMQGKGLPSLIPPQAIIRLARRFEDGAAKYSRNNWMKGIPLSRFQDAIQRHLLAAAEGKTDEDHLGAVLWNAAAWIWTEDEIAAGRLPAELDDLPYREHRRAE